DAVMNQLAGYGGEHRIVISREGAMDELLIRVEADGAHAERGDAALATLRDSAAQKLAKLLGLRAKVEVVLPGTFPRTDFKARRVIDDRDVFRDMHRRLAG
ncbi:MAG: phenylacetate--CoA ligase family protein, partial [Casimicrobiaceae bacterium]